MKLTNPTDSELNAAFAEKVAGWHKNHNMVSDGRFLAADLWYLLPNYCCSADAVLPWLDKMNYVATSYPVSGNEHHNCIITIYTWHTAEKLGEAYATAFPRACVIALLRAHGVEVELAK